MDGFLNFWAEQGVDGFIRIFWFYFIFEFPRYVFLDYVFLLIYKLKSRFNKVSYEAARLMLWEEKPLVTIIVPGKDEGKKLLQAYKITGRANVSKLPVNSRG
jgi:poly-beta-1,6-N-acetyl-D-glucosamine synthase